MEKLTLTKIEQEEKYTDILRYFGVNYYDYSNPLITRTYVSMDNIHDAIIKEGVNMVAPLSFYIIKAKQLAINELSVENRRAEILIQHFQYLFEDVEFTPDFIAEYAFIGDEITVANEIAAGVPRYKSVVTRRRYSKALEGIRQKVIQSI